MHSDLHESIQRSAKAFRFGDRAGSLTGFLPADFRIPSNAGQYLPSRSCMTYFISFRKPAPSRSGKPRDKTDFAVTF